MTSYFSCFWGWSGRSCSPCHSWGTLRRWQSVDAGLGWGLLQASHTRVASILAFGGYWPCPQPLPLDGTPPGAFPHGLPAGAPSILIDSSKKQTQRLLNILVGYAWSCHRPCGSSKSEGQSRFKVGKDTLAIHSSMAWVYSAGARRGLWHLLWRPSVCVVWGMRVGWWGNEEILHEMSERIVFILTACH